MSDVSEEKEKGRPEERSGEPGAVEERPGGPTADEEARGAPLPDSGTLVASCIHLLSAKAWETMGLVPNPATGKVERNFGEARIAIDAASALAEVLKPGVGEAERKEIENLVANLRLNFVEQRRKAE